MIGIRWRHFVPALIVLVAGCGGSAWNNPFATRPGPHDRSAFVIVTNDNWLDAVVHARHLGSRVRIGDVTSQARRTLEIPPGFLGATGAVELEVSLIGSSERYRTGELYVPLGQRVELAIRNHLSTSSWSILPD